MALLLHRLDRQALGWAVLPAFANARRNSELVALFSGDADKRRELSEKYGVPAFDYDEYEPVLARGEIDAVYVVTPNALHREHTILAARRGVHVLCEKPLADSSEACRAMIDACRENGVKLMTAYRLHFEEANLTAVEMVTGTGEVIRADAEQNQALFWALRGGGGNFGVVTEFEFELHRTGTRALSVELDFPVPGAAPAMAAWRDLAATAPRAATYAAMVKGGIVTLGFVWVGDPDAGREQARAPSALGRPSAERLVELSYLEL